MTFENQLLDPPEDITAEIACEAEEHQVFFGGDAVGELFMHMYADAESDYAENAVGDDLPVGLTNSVTTGTAGMGELIVVLQHLPAVNDAPVKDASLSYPPAEGEADASVPFELTVE